MKDTIGNWRITFLFTTLVFLVLGSLCAREWNPYHYDLLLDICGNICAITVICSFAGFAGTFLYEIWK